MLLAAYRDKNGVAKTFNESLEYINLNLRVPVFHLYEHGFGKGVLGGKVVSHFSQGKIAAQIAMDVISGKSIKDIPVVEGGMPINSFLIANS